MEGFWETVVWLLGLGRSEPTWWQMSLRAAVIFVIGIALARFGSRRFLGRNTAFDMLLVVILGSVLSRAINGGAPFVQSVAAGLALVALHWVLAYIAFHSHAFGQLVKGNVLQLVRDGVIQWGEMRKSLITKNDLMEELHINARITETDQVDTAWLERSGEISVIPKKAPPRVLEVSVASGVQTVRIQVE